MARSMVRLMSRTMALNDSGMREAISRTECAARDLGWCSSPSPSGNIRSSIGSGCWGLPCGSYGLLIFNQAPLKWLYARSRSKVHAIIFEEHGESLRSSVNCEHSRKGRKRASRNQSPEIGFIGRKPVSACLRKSNVLYPRLSLDAKSENLMSANGLELYDHELGKA